MTAPPRTILNYASNICVRGDGLHIAVARYFDAAFNSVTGAFLWRAPDFSDLKSVTLAGQGRMDEGACVLADNKLLVVTKGDDPTPAVREYLVDESAASWSVALVYAFGVPTTRGCQICTLDDGRVAVVGYRQGEGVNFDVALRRLELPPVFGEATEPLWRTQWFQPTGPGGQPAVDLAAVPWMDGRLACFFSRDGSHSIGIGLIGAGETLTLDTFNPELVNDQNDPKQPSKKIFGDMAPDMEYTGITAARDGERVLLCYGRSRDIHQVNAGGENLVQPVVTAIGADMKPLLVGVFPNTEQIDADHGWHTPVMPRWDGVYVWYRQGTPDADPIANQNAYDWRLGFIAPDGTVTVGLPGEASGFNAYVAWSPDGYLWFRQADAMQTAMLQGADLPPSPPKLFIQRAGAGNVLLTWDAPGYVLQTAPETSGPWADTILTSPAVVSSAGTMGFYRLRKEQ